VSARALGRRAGWLLPGAALVLMPKCPACVAAYVAMGTGLGLSLGAAAALRSVTVALCLVALTFLVARAVRRWVTAGLREKT
jgi:hypothetical protein